MKKVLLIFIDGFGIGELNSEINPLVAFPMKIFHKLLGQPLSKVAVPFISDRCCIVPTDANLDIPGLPQSATGQTALFTGINAASVMGRHILGFPGPQLAQIIAENGLMRELVDAGCKTTSANMYTNAYMDMVAGRKRRHSASTLTILGAGLPLRSETEMLAGEAVYQDVTNESLPLLVGVSGIPPVTPAEAGRRLAALANSHHFTLFEYFQTDRQGHKREWPEAEKIIGVLDEFLLSVFRLSGEVLVIITSDHGNFEDFSVKTHTNNPVPTIIWGPGCRQAAAAIRNLTHIKPAIMNYLREGENFG